MYTLKVSYLTALLTGATSQEKLCKAFEELRKADIALETAKKEYLVVVTKDELAGEEEYLAKEKTAIQSVSLAVDVESKGTMESYHIISYLFM